MYNRRGSWFVGREILLLGGMTLFEKNTYEVTVDMHIRATIKTQANTADEAAENVQNDYENSTTAEFLNNYEWDERNFEITYVE